jgi:urease accessory protein
MLMLLADARLPTGAHTQSAGLEPALRAGLDPSDVPLYIKARLRTVTTVEAAAAVVARARTVAATARADQLDLNVTGGTRVNEFGRAVEVDPRGLGGGLREVDAAWRARTISPALRETSVLLGRGYARLVRRLWPDTAGAAALAAIGRPGRAVVLGVAAALAGLSAAQLVRLIGYDDAQTVAAATLKLEPLDPVVTIGWVMAAGPDIERMVGDLAQLTEIEQIPALGAPLIEQWAEIHSVTNQRLFRA